MRILSNIIAQWPAPSHIGALTTTRENGVSRSAFAYNNLGLHVGDDAQNVFANRRVLKETLHLPAEPVWLEQTHSNRCIVAEKDTTRQADAVITRDAKYPLLIMTADCLPILLCDRDGTEIAAIHAGWRGLANGIIENTLAQMDCTPATMFAWIGPGICQNCFEVGDEVLHAFVKRYPFSEQSFQKNGLRMQANLPKIAEQILKAQGVSLVYHSNLCTVEQENQFYSYRRDGETGRMASLIWFKQEK